jgi:hypothetical protein
MSIRFYIQNAGWASLNPSEAYQAKKAMDEYKKTHKVCEITGSDKNVQIHHIVPVWADPSLAADPNNFIALSTQANIHLIFGHNGSYAKRYIKDVKQIANSVRFLLDEADIVIRPQILAYKSNPMTILRSLYGWFVQALKRFLGVKS